MQIPVAGFTRLKSLFRSGINLIDYDKILKSALNAEVGSLPRDIIGKILAGTKTANPAEQIAIAKNGIVDALAPLRRGIEVNQRAQTIYMRKAFPQIDIPKERLLSLDFFDDIDFSKLSLDAPKINVRGVKEASKELTETFSKIIPNCSEVKVTALNSGAYGMGYKLEFLDSTGEKILHDKVLKLFYEENMQTKLFNMVGEGLPKAMQYLKNLCDGMSKRDLITLFRNIKTKVNSLSVDKIMEMIKPYEGELAKNNITITPEHIQKTIDKINSLKIKDIKEFCKVFKEVYQNGTEIDFSQFMKQAQNHSSRIHGAMAEANTSTYLRSRLGHSLSKTDVIAPDYYDLKRGYAIAEYSDDLLPKPTSDVDFSLLGLSHLDLHEGNKVAGRIVDVGGVTSLESLLDDKLTSRYYKKIMNQKNPKCRAEYIEYLQEKMKQMNLLDKQKVQNAIDKAKTSMAEWGTPQFESNYIA